jgi:methylthioribose-1-phosphate isomerase
MAVRTIAWEGELPGHVVLLEQTKLPLEHIDVAVRSVEEMADAIARLAVRGAPAIGVAAAYGVVLGAQAASGLRGEEALARILTDCDRLAASRPTAVNLFWALDRMRARARAARLTGADGTALASALLAEARAIHREDAEQCRRMGAIGAELIRDGMTLLTHCNAGALATGGIGTALAPIYAALEQGKKVRVFADETRPLLQGARLTAWELADAGIEVTLITDSMAGRVMFEGKVDLVLVGSDRIARNGDVCNKIGTYTVAVLARRHAIPFYVVAPLSTFDPRVESGDQIPIEERPGHEVTEGLGRRTAPPGVGVYNPAFDITPAELVTGIVTEVGLIESPDRRKVEDALRRGGRAL